VLANKSTECSAIRPSNFTIATPVEVRLVEILNISNPVLLPLAFSWWLDGLFAAVGKKQPDARCPAR
jgi:hypothetical protein